MDSTGRNSVSGFLACLKLAEADTCMDLLKSLAFIVASVAFSGVAGAASVSCPGTATTNDREFVMTTTGTATCISVANGNALNGTTDPANALGYVTLDSATATGGPYDGLLTIGPTPLGTSGTFTVNNLLFPSGYTSFVLGFSATVAQVNPDSYLFSLPAGVFGGTWSITTGDPSRLGALTRAYIYGMPAPVPLPAAAWLLLSGLVGFAAVARRRKSA